MACDVDNALLGKDSPALMYAPQKGATPTQVRLLDQGMHQLAGVIKKRLRINVSNIKGAGAAGGLGAGLVAFCGAHLSAGVEVVGEAVGLQKRMSGAHLVITGEGRIDRQTFRGKVPHGVAKMAQSLGIPTVAIVGAIGEGADACQNYGILVAEPICIRPMTEDEAKKETAILVSFAAQRIFRMMTAGTLLGDN